MSIQIIPAIIPKSFHDLEDRINDIKDVAEIVQIDVMDGLYVPDKSWPYTVVDDPDFERIRKDGSGLPGWKDVQFEVDLMVQNPEEIWRSWMQAGVSRLIVHLESTKDLKSILRDFRKESVSKGSFIYGNIGIAIGTETENEELYPYIEDIDFVQFMGIKNIGYQGQKFEESVVDKIKELKTRNPNICISVDGGMKQETIALVHGAGAERVAVGSAIFKNGNPIENYKHLINL